MNETGLTTTQLSYVLGNRTLVDAVDLHAPRGQLTALLGPNGAGKSTLLRLLVGALPASSGSAAFRGANLTTLPRRARAQLVALLEQDWVPGEGLTGRDVVELGRVPYQRWFAPDPHANDDIVETALHQAGASAFAGQDVSTLSGGERQRVNVARALAQQPELLLCDEPTNHLDIHAQLELLTLIHGLTRGGLTAVTALHDLNHAATFADHIVVLANGAVHAAGTPQDVLTPELIADVWQVHAQVLRRPGSERPLIVFDAPQL